MFPSADAYLPGSQFLEHDRTQLNDAQRGLAPSDDGVDTRTVSVVWADSAVAVAIERHGIAAITALALTRDQILSSVWGEDTVVDAHTVDNFVSNLRKKLEWNSGSRFEIRSVRGVGYRMDLHG